MMSIGILVMAGQEICSEHRKMGNGLYETFHTDGKTVYNPELMAMPVGTDFSTIHRVERYRDWYADKNRVYYENRLLSEAKPQTV